MVWQLWARSLARIKASASGAENPGFKSQRARHPRVNMYLFRTFLISQSPFLRKYAKSVVQCVSGPKLIQFCKPQKVKCQKSDIQESVNKDHTGKQMFPLLKFFRHLFNKRGQYAFRVQKIKQILCFNNDKKYLVKSACGECGKIKGIFQGCWI